ncbi:hypothetical protein [Streptomyces rochei]|uniref:hypothetical protein n=1 Tax=Streptomyces rochei TaxID=1928 RepID=UPI0036379AC5
MQITMPCGLGIGPGGQCSDAMCFNAATHVLEHHTDSGVRRAGAYCTPCLNRKVRPAAQDATADELDIMYGRAGGMNGLPDDMWKIRAFAADELAELEAIRNGALLSLYVGPGNFIWATPADIEADRERRTAAEEAAKQVRRSRSRL